MSSTRYVCKAVPEKGWRVWNRATKRWWGNYFKDFPTDLIDELNGDKRPEVIVKMCRPGFQFGRK